MRRTRTRLAPTCLQGSSGVSSTCRPISSSTAPRTAGTSRTMPLAPLGHDGRTKARRSSHPSTDRRSPHPAHLVACYSAHGHKRATMPATSDRQRRQCEWSPTRSVARPAPTTWQMRSSVCRHRDLRHDPFAASGDWHEARASSKGRDRRPDRGGATRVRSCDSSAESRGRQPSDRDAAGSPFHG